MTSPILGSRVRARRARLRLTQAALAAKLGHQLAWVQRVEAETRGTTLEGFVQLCEVLETTPNYLLGYKQRA